MLVIGITIFSYFVYWKLFLNLEMSYNLISMTVFAFSIGTNLDHVLTFILTDSGSSYPNHLFPEYL